MWFVVKIQRLWKPAAKVALAESGRNPEANVPRAPQHPGGNPSRPPGADFDPDWKDPTLGWCTADQLASSVRSFDKAIELFEQGHVERLRMPGGAFQVRS